ncbi:MULTISPECIES: competence type IV pilus minor pilin ComGG [unclassified Enterococcus]|uniref:competence type IV pilus minor pilin ComGG n=1 Tax=unclassified Enterococcus TaxID=2608891 RepID=UPI001CE14BE8|nr:MULTISPECIES: competence type IV pilus minor pilin ComGG [unclassified Enterococcus]MCA5013204.1 hypothetical protein [Enterococcus sp. S23]MCA5016454.1 hypothetical protein [Enterococcus sp. S22(2020)]
MKKGYKGGILLTSLLLVFLSSSLFLLVLEEFKLAQQFSQKTKDYYIAKTMVSMFLAEVKQKSDPLDPKGTQEFSAGHLTYSYAQQTLTIVVKMNHTTYTFNEVYQPQVSKEKTDISE